MQSNFRRCKKDLSEFAYRPKVISTVGARPACLVNASVIYAGDDQIYVFGGFDQYTDEVYNHVLKLNLATQQWSLVDNYGDIPGVRMGHTANLWRGNKLLIFGGENEHRSFLSDVIMLDLETLHWTQPELQGHAPRGRARHASVIHDEKLWIVGGLMGQQDNHVLDDICYLDLRTWTWSIAWRFVPRYDHTCWIWGGRIWVFGGMNEDMERTSEIWWLDLRETSISQNHILYNMADSMSASKYSQGGMMTRATTSTLPTAIHLNQHGQLAQSHMMGQIMDNLTGHGFSQNNVAMGSDHANVNVTLGSISSVKFVSSANLTSQTAGQHFHVYTSGYLLDFCTPANVSNTSGTCLSALDLESLRWQKLLEGKELFSVNYRWHYCTMDGSGSQVWLLGSLVEPSNPGDASLSECVHIDLRKMGLFEYGTERHWQQVSSKPLYSSLTAIGADLVKFFDLAPETGSGTDFIITAEADDTQIKDIDEGYGEEEEISEPDIEAIMRIPLTFSPANSPTSNYTMTSTSSIEGKSSLSSSSTSGSLKQTKVSTVSGKHRYEENKGHISVPIHVHRLILLARWPHFARLYAAHMMEFHTNRMHVPEPYRTVRSFLLYLYTDSIAPIRLSARKLDSHDGKPKTRVTRKRRAGGSGSDSEDGRNKEIYNENKGRKVSANQTNGLTRLNGYPSLVDVAGVLVLAAYYDMPRLQSLAVNRLGRELDIEHAAIIWERASRAGEAWLKRRAAMFCMLNWGRVVRTTGFRRLGRKQVLELCSEVDLNGRVMRGDELEGVGGMIGTGKSWIKEQDIADGIYAHDIMEECNGSGGGENGNGNEDNSWIRAVHSNCTPSNGENTGNPVDNRYQFNGQTNHGRANGSSIYGLTSHGLRRSSRFQLFEARVDENNAHYERVSNERLGSITHEWQYNGRNRQYTLNSVSIHSDETEQDDDNYSESEDTQNMDIGV